MVAIDQAINPIQDDATIRMQAIYTVLAPYHSISTHDLYNADTEPMPTITLPRASRSLIVHPSIEQQHTMPLQISRSVTTQDAHLRYILILLWIVGMAIILLVMLYVHFPVR